MAVSPAASGLVDGLQAKMSELEAALAGVTEEEASRPIDGDWTIRHILSHLLGAEGPSLVERLQTFIDQDMPTVDVAIDDPVFTPSRQRMSYAQLFDAVRKQYADMAAFLSQCTEEHFERRGRIPEYFKNTPLTDTPTLSLWSVGLIQFHLADHIKQISEHRTR